MRVDVDRLLKRELRAVYRAACADDNGWRELAEVTARGIGAGLGAVGVSLHDVAAAVRSAHGVLIESMLDNANARALALVGTVVATELLEAFCTRAEGLADALLAGRVPDGAAVSYTVVSVRGAARDETVDAFRRRGAVLEATSGHLLLPLAESATLSLCEHVRGEIGGEAWLCIAERPVALVASAREEVDEIDALVEALGRPPGVYRIDDVAVESALAATPEVRDELGKIIAPLLANRVLVQTVLALLEADGNRAVAVKKLFIHRSTIDYRLWQIEQLTGLRPGNPRDLALLGAAIALNRAKPGD
ncbi:PucR family transcriptional regulator [Lentzea albida]|uniref:PucR C-terminal helix-turn-helix domain-containing protein n=1 Tax=Lentzea albida TaxID=65499 RepID=A0A1H9WTI8_9PSEU|nr:PucR family transcriptional regulator [Lentzea albida]SES37248.1 PucR C-terminal helix-turn-helix domain-containing protein [Lentzea albida]